MRPRRIDWNRVAFVALLASTAVCVWIVILIFNALSMRRVAP